MPRQDHTIARALAKRTLQAHREREGKLLAQSNAAQSNIHSDTTAIGVLPIHVT